MSNKKCLNVQQKLGTRNVMKNLVKLLKKTLKLWNPAAIFICKNAETQYVHVQKSPRQFQCPLESQRYPEEICVHIHIQFKKNVMYEYNIKLTSSKILLSYIVKGCVTCFNEQIHTYTHIHTFIWAAKVTRPG